MDNINGRRDRRICFRVTDAEYLDLQTEASKMGYTVTRFCREELLAKEPLPAPKISPEIAREIATNLSRYGNNLNQIARKLNTGDDMDTESLEALKSIRAGMVEIWKILKAGV